MKVYIYICLCQGCSSPATNDKCEDLDNNVIELKRQTLVNSLRLDSFLFVYFPPDNCPVDKDVVIYHFVTLNC